MVLSVAETYSANHYPVIRKQEPKSNIGCALKEG